MSAQASAHRFDFAPPRDERWPRPLSLAIAAHVLLVAALTWGVAWRHQGQIAAVSAELWATMPEIAAPPPPVVTRPVQAETPPSPVETPPPDQAAQDATIATQKREAEARERKLREEQQRQEQLRQKRLEDERKARELAEQKKREDAARRAAEKKAEAQIAAERDKLMERIMKQAGNGSSTSLGQQTRNAGSTTSGGWGAKVRGAILPNIVYTDSVAGNPEAVVEVRLLPDGTIIGRKLLKASGVPSWDEAVLRAVDRTGRLPRDENGRVEPTINLVVRPNDTR